MSNQIIKVCIDKILPKDLTVQAAKRAVSETPANTPILVPGFGVTSLRPLEIAALTGKMWRTGRVLRVHFLDGELSVQEKVKQYAHKWSEYANITFEFGSDPDAEIRISFQEPGSWSYIGTDCLTIGKSDPTMNFGWLTPTTEEDEYSRVVLHEFGHALGCIHEHQNPTVEIPWNKDAVYSYYMGPPNNWTKDQVDFNIFEKYSIEQTQYTAWDEESIMEYPIPQQLTTGGFTVGWNTVLSTIDKEFITSRYPANPKLFTDLIVGAFATEASIGKHGEEDFYRFVITKEGQYVIETQGRTNVVMALFGPDNQTNLVAADDDSGRGYNAKIVTMLKSGTYYARIRHHQTRGTGKYKVSVQVEQ